MRFARFLSPPAVVLLLSACSDPVKDTAIDSLGGEAPGVSPGPLHRPGQPCLYCHDGYGPGELEFSVAGTAFQYADSKTPLANAIVHVIDSRGRTARTGTNCAGNFFFQKADYDPSYPIWTTLEFGGVLLEMSTPIFRDGSCSSCHRDPASESSVGHIYFAPPGLPLPGGACP